MSKELAPPIQRRFVNYLIVGTVLVLLALAPLVQWSRSGEMGMPDSRVFDWPTYLEERISGPAFEDPSRAMAEAEMTKFNLIWLYLANVNNSLALHQQTHFTSRAFLADCYNFQDYIGSLHQMIYASHALDVHVLNDIYPDLGSKFLNSYIKGANLMVSACLAGSEEKYRESRAASDDWFAWYADNGKGVESSLSKLVQ